MITVLAPATGKVAQDAPPVTHPDAVSAGIDFTEWLKGPTPPRILVSVKSVTCVAVVGTDALAQSRILGPVPFISGNTVRMRWGSMLPNVVYRLSVTVSARSVAVDDVLTLTFHQACV